MHSRLNIISYSWDKTTHESFIRFTLANILSACSFFLIAFKMFNQTLVMSIIYGVLVILMIFLLRFSYFASKYYNIYGRKNLYGEAIRHLQEGFSAIHWLRSQEIDKEKFISAMEFLLDKLKIIFEAKTKSECSVSIKIPTLTGKMSSETKIINICRDTNSGDRNTEAYIKKPHLISANTCFNNICDGLANSGDYFYVNNNIPKSEDYKNSSTSTYKHNKLPYVSEIVVPLIPLYVTEADTETELIALGFLCVDSNKTNVFDTRYDLDILQGVAEGIYDIIKLRNNFITIPNEIIEKSTPNKKKQTFVLKDRTNHHRRN